MIHNPNPDGRGTETRAAPPRLVLAALNPNPDQPAGDPMTQQLRPGREPVGMSPEAVAARRAAVVQQMRAGNTAWLNKRAAERGELPLGEDGDE